MAEAQLQRRGITPDRDSRLFRTLCLELGKLELLYRDAEEARRSGDYSKEEEFIGYFKRHGYRQLTSDEVDTHPSTPKLSVAWGEFFAEKTSGAPVPAWKPKTARTHQATFDEFVELVSDIPVDQVDREVIRAYLAKAAGMPKNRRKLYPDQSAAELLAMDWAPSQLPSSRTIAEKLVQIGSFLKWCRLTKNYINHDPTEGISVRASSRSYAPFSKSDLKRLFENQTYFSGGHRKMWHFWVPLLALYTGARQTEIAQLRVADVYCEDDVWVLVITDTGPDQQIKTKAGIRKVPINALLQRIGFLDYVGYLKTEGFDRVLPDLPKGSISWGQKISRWFNDTYRRKCGIQPDPTGGRKVFHSFRHTAITQATGAGLPLQFCQQVFGHEKSLLGETATYTHQYPASRLVPVTEALTFGLDHSPYLGGWREYVGFLRSDE